MWDQRYSVSEFVYGTEPNDFLKAEYSRIPRNGQVLCLAEGEGRNAVFLAKQGYSVTAVDQSPVGLKKAESLAGTQNVSIATNVSDLGDYDLGHEKWDGIVSISAHLPPALRRDLHARVFAALKRNGIFLLEAYTQEQLKIDGIGGPPPSQKELFMSLHELKLELSELDWVIGQEVTRSICEGQYHQGKSSVVQLIATKTS